MNNSLFERLQHASLCCLSGLMANPLTLNNDYQKQLRMRNMTIEKMAIISASQMLEELERYREACKRDEETQKKKLSVVEDDPKGAS